MDDTKNWYRNGAHVKTERLGMILKNKLIPISQGGFIMTKLFSMKSLAFAGAAAFALTLAAAPKVDAASISSISDDLSHVYVNDEKEELTETEDGLVIYYQLAKDAASLKDGKYTAVTDENLGVYNLSSLAGKNKYLSLSVDGTKEGQFAGFMVNKAPKVKIQHKGGETKLKIGNTDATLYNSEYGDLVESDIVTQGGIRAKAGDVIYYLYGMDSETVKTAGVLGANLSVTVATPVTYKKENGKETDIIEAVTAPATAKYKVTARAKAPKVSLKLDAKKPFEWNLSTKQEYLINCKSEDVKTGWKDGSKASWDNIFKGAGVADATVAKIVSGDAITADVDISVRVKKTDNKAASAINVVKLKRSAASPTTQASIATTKATWKDEKQTKLKTPTTAAITANADIQYSVDAGKTWKVLKATKTQKFTKDTQKEILVRIVTPAKNGIVLPSLNTKMTWDPQTGKANTAAFGYDESGAVKIVETKDIEVK